MADLATDVWNEFLEKIKLHNDVDIMRWYEAVTDKLNDSFGKGSSLQVGSYGRKTGVNSLSDFDMVYIVPGVKWSVYNKPNG